MVFLASDIVDILTTELSVRAYRDSEGVKKKHTLHIHLVGGRNERAMHTHSLCTGCLSKDRNEGTKSKQGEGRGEEKEG